MPSKLKYTFHLNDLILLINFSFLFWGLLILNNFNHFTESINQFTILLFLLFTIQNIIMLLIERKFKIPLLLVLILFISIFFLLRIISFYYSGFSRALYLSGNIDSWQYNYALIFIISSVFMLCLGLILSSLITKKPPTYKNDNIPYINKNIILLLSLAMASTIMQLMVMLTPGFLGNNLISYFIRIFPVKYMLFYCLLYLLICKRYNNKFYHKKRTWLLFYIILNLVLITAIGSRRFLLDIILFSLFISLVIDVKSVKFSFNQIIFFILIIIPVGFIVYDLATYLRWARMNQLVKLGESINYMEILPLYIKSGLFQTEGLIKQFDRIGYLDMAIETITYSKTYEPILNFSYYLKSIIDNLSPGVQVFNVALSGQAKQFIFNYGYLPTLTDVLTNNYNSNAFSIFGEIYTLFGGFLSFPIFFFLGYLINMAYIKVNKMNNLFDTIFFKSIIIFIFFEFFLFSFGLDWLFVNFFKIYLSYLIIRPILKNMIKPIIRYEYNF